MGVQMGSVAGLLALCAGCEAITGPGTDYDAWTGPYAMHYEVGATGHACYYDLGLMLLVGSNHREARLGTGISHCDGATGDVWTQQGDGAFKVSVSGTAESPRISFSLNHCRFTGSGSGTTDEHRWSGDVSCDQTQGGPSGTGHWEATEDNRFQH